MQLISHFAQTQNIIEFRMYKFQMTLVAMKKLPYHSQHRHIQTAHGSEQKIPHPSISTLSIIWYISKFGDLFCATSIESYSPSSLLQNGTQTQSSVSEQQVAAVV